MRKGLPESSVLKGQSEQLGKPARKESREYSAQLAHKVSLVHREHRDSKVSPGPKAYPDWPEILGQQALKDFKGLLDLRLPGRRTFNRWAICPWVTSRKERSRNLRETRGTTCVHESLTIR